MEDRELRRRRAERYVATARLVVLWERIWPAMWPGMGIIGAGMILALLNFFSILPGVAHALFLILLFGSATYFFWKTFSPFRTPKWEDGARRVERDSDLPNRPITEGSDVVAAGKGDPFAEGLGRALCGSSGRDRRLLHCGTTRRRSPCVGIDAGVRPNGRQFGVRCLGIASDLHGPAAAFADRYLGRRRRRRRSGADQQHAGDAA